MTWVRANDLDSYTQKRDMQELLPEIIRRLVWTSTSDDQIVSIDMPAGDQIGRQGWDGKLKLKGVSGPWLRNGISQWELGTGEDPWKKATEDHTKRKRLVSQSRRKQMTYIFVTTKNWVGDKGKDVWLKRRANDGWKEILAYDANDLEQWLEVSQPVALWLAERIGIKPEGCMSFAEHWLGVTGAFTPKLNDQVFLASREQQFQEILKLANGTPAVIGLTGLSRSEGIDFISAGLSQHASLQSKAILVQSESAWETLSQTENNCLLVPSLSLELTPEQIARAVQRGKHVILPGDPWESKNKSLQIPLPYWPQLAHAMANGGRVTTKIEKLSRNCCGNTATLKRLCKKHGGPNFPEWATCNEVAELASYALVGGWQHLEKDVGDIESRNLFGLPYQDVTLIELLTEKNRESIEKDIATWSKRSEPLFVVFGHSVLVSSREDAWLLLARHLSQKQIDNFLSAAIYALSQNDPSLSLPAADRWAAAMFGKKSEFSRELKTSLIETLALISTRPTIDNVSNSNALLNVPRKVLDHCLPQGCSWERWASLRNDLSLLAEASPEQFLQKLEADLNSSSPSLRMLFQDRNSGTLSSSPHLGLLRALEVLLWKPAFFRRVVKVIAQLAVTDKGGSWVNRPQKTLENIFSDWYPQPNFPAALRLSAVDDVFGISSDLTFETILECSASCTGRIAHPLATPRWRDWHEELQPAGNPVEYVDYLAGIEQRLLKLCAGSISRTASLLRKSLVTSGSRFDTIRQSLESIDMKEIADSERKLLSGALRDYLSLHKDSGKKGRMPKRDYNKLSRLLDSLVPTDAVLRHSWLFDWLSHHPQIPIGQPMEAHDSKFFADRKIAIREVIQQGGAKDVLRLAQDCRDKTLPGLLVARERLLSPKELGLDDLLLSDDPAEKQLAHGYVFGYVEAGKSSSLLRKAAGWSVLAQARLAMWMPFGVRTWNWIDKRGAKARSIYWKNCSQFGTEKNIRSVRRAVQSLLDVHRPFSAIYVVSRALQSDIAIRTPEIIRVLLAGQAKSVEPAGQSLSYSVQQLFKVLQSDGNVDLQQLAMLEWDYFDLLDIHSEVTWDGIYRALAESAETFVSLVKWMVRAEGEPARKRPVSAIEQRNGERAFTIVQNANKIPGVSNDQLNSDILKNWIKEARVRASKCKRLSITEGLIGNLLARCPSDHNGKWPHRELCSVLENHASDGILEGYTLELMKQDPTWRAPTDGGTIEREESRSLRNAAAEILYEFPRVSKSIEAAADFFERSAVRHDQSANRFRIGR